MRTPDDIKNAKAEYNSNLVNTELSSLPLGYVFGGALTVSDSDVTLAPLIANVHGKQITKPNITNIRDMEWIVPKVNNTRFYIYLDRYGDWFVSTVAPVVVEGRYGTYNPRTLTRHIGSIYVNDDGNYQDLLDMEDNAIINVDYIDFDLVNGITPAEGRLVWNDDDGTLNLGLKGGNVNLQIGLEQVFRAKNTSGSTMADGTPVIVTGATGSNPEIGLSDANNLAAAENVGLTTEEITDGQYGYVTTFGMVRDIDTSGTPVGETWSNVDKIYVSDTAGKLTNVRPAGSSRVLFVGVVIRAHATEGVIGVYPIHVFYIEELSGIGDTGLADVAEVNDLTSANITKTLPEISGKVQRIPWYWDNGGTYKLTPAVTDGATIDGIAAALWLGEGKGHMVIESDGTNWQTREYEDSGSNSNGEWWKESSGRLVCTYTDSAVHITTAAQGNVWASAGQTPVFPKTFNAAPQVITSVIHNSGRPWPGMTLTISTTQFSLYIMGKSVTDAGSFAYTATGKWKA